MENWITHTSSIHQTMASILVRFSLLTERLQKIQKSHTTCHSCGHSRKWEQQLWKSVDMRSTNVNCKTFCSCSVECLAIFLGLFGCLCFVGFQHYCLLLKLDRNGRRISVELTNKYLSRRPISTSSCTAEYVVSKLLILEICLTETDSFKISSTLLMQLMLRTSPDFLKSVAGN